jgi:hypothetical protein
VCVQELAGFRQLLRRRVVATKVQRSVEERWVAQIRAGGVSHVCPTARGGKPTLAAFC